MMLLNLLSESYIWQDYIYLFQYFVYIIFQLKMYRELSPIRSVSPAAKPKIVFNYQPSPIKQRLTQHHRLSNLNPSDQKSFVQNIHQKSFTPVKIPENHKINYQARPHQHQQNKPPNFMNENMNINVHNANNLYYKQKANLKMVSMDRKQVKDSKRVQNIDESALKARQMNELNRIPSSKVLQSHQMRPQEKKNKEEQLESFVQKISEEEGQLKSILSNINQEAFNQKIKLYYKQLKLKLKGHYESIKQSIKLSIERDLLELQNQQKELLKYMQTAKHILEDNLMEISSIIQDILPHKVEILTKIQEQPFKQMLQKYQIHFAKIEQGRAKVQKIIDEIQSDGGDKDMSVLSSFFQGFKREKGKLEKKALYLPEHYIMFDCDKKQACFSFDNEKND